MILSAFHRGFNEIWRYLHLAERRLKVKWKISYGLYWQWLLEGTYCKSGCIETIPDRNFPWYFFFFWNVIFVNKINFFGKHKSAHCFDILQNSASSFHRLSSSIFTCLLSSFVVRRPSRIVTSPLISTIWCFTPYKPYIFCEDMILATCQCEYIYCCWVEPSLLLSSFYLVITEIQIPMTEIIWLGKIAKRKWSSKCLPSLNRISKCQRKIPHRIHFSEVHQPH